MIWVASNRPAIVVEIEEHWIICGTGVEQKRLFLAFLARHGRANSTGGERKVVAFPSHNARFGIGPPTVAEGTRIAKVGRSEGEPTVKTFRSKVIDRLIGPNLRHLAIPALVEGQIC